MGISGIKWSKKGCDKTRVWSGCILLIVNILLQIYIMFMNG